MTDTQLSPGLAEDAALQLEHNLTSIVRDEIGMHEAMATLFAQALVRGMRREFGGEVIYIPVPSRAERDAAIRSQFDGTNLAEVMKRHDISRATVYRVSGRRDPQSVAIGISSAKNPISSLPMRQDAE